jgi:hypothetical protein
VPLARLSLADQGLQLHYIMVVAKLALPKNCHFLAEQGSAVTVTFFQQTKVYNYTFYTIYYSATF